MENTLVISLLNFNQERFDDCIEGCEKLLLKNQYDQSAWCLKMMALTESLRVDDLEIEDFGIAETTLDDCSISTLSKPGTSFQSASMQGDNLSMAMRPMSKSGRPNSGFLRPGTGNEGSKSLEQAIKTPRTAHTARPVSATSGRFVRLGTASMLSNKDGPFINISRINLQKYAERPEFSKSLFEYIYYHENDIRHALELASYATEKAEYKDWWWKLQIGKCYFRFGLYRDAEQQFRSAIKEHPILDVYLWLGKVFQRLDQPLTAIEIYDQGLEKFNNDLSLMTAKLRVYEILNDSEKCKNLYQKILCEDNMNIEVIACVANNYFYEDQPEIALNYYRRLFQMGIKSPELLNNIALCCFYSNQFDMFLTCFQQAITMATKENLADIYYNIAIVALSIGDINLAYQNFRMALTYENEHAESYNNLGVLDMQKGNIDGAKAFLQASTIINPKLFEPHYNFGLLAERNGDLQTSYMFIKKCLNIFPNHYDAKDLMKSLSELFSSV